MFMLSSGAKQKRLNSHGKQWLEICNPMNDFLSTFSDSEYQGCVGMEMAKRPNSGGQELLQMIGSPKNH